MRRKIQEMGEREDVGLGFTDRSATGENYLRLFTFLYQCRSTLRFRYLLLLFLCLFRLVVLFPPPKILVYFFQYFYLF